MSETHAQTSAGLPAFVTWIERLSRFAGVIAALCLASIVVMMLAEVLARNLFNQSLHVTWELSAYGMGAMFFLAASSTMLRGEHVRVGILFELVGPRIGRAIDMAVTLFGLAVAAYVSAALFGLTWRSLSGDVRSWTGYRFPLFIPQSLLSVGAGLLALQLVARMTRLLTRHPAEDRVETGAEAAVEANVKTEVQSGNNKSARS